MEKGKFTGKKKKKKNVISCHIAVVGYYTLGHLYNKSFFTQCDESLSMSTCETKKRVKNACSTQGETAGAGRSLAVTVGWNSVQDGLPFFRQFYYFLCYRSHAAGVRLMPFPQQANVNLLSHIPPLTQGFVFCGLVLVL